MKGTRRRPAASIVASRVSGSLSGEAQCGIPLADRRVAVVSSIRPIEALTRLSSAMSAPLITPGLRCGSSPVSSSTSRAARARYSSVVSQPSARSSALAARYRSSGLSPSVKSASRQPAVAPARATSSTSSSVMYARSPRRGGRAKVQ